MEECPALFWVVRLASPKGAEAGKSCGMTAAAFPKQGGVNAKKLFVKRDDALWKKARARYFGPTSLFFSFRKSPRRDNHSIQIFCKSPAIFFAFAEPCHILSMEDGNGPAFGPEYADGRVRKALSRPP